MQNYAPENASFLLPFTTNPQALEQDLKTCMNYEFLKNYIPENGLNKNYLLPLRSIEGRMDFPIAVANRKNEYRDTEILEKCAYFKQVIDQLKCEKEAIRLMNLAPGAGLNTHTDYCCGYEDGIFRVHVPITTNDDVHFILNDNRLIMKPGEVWYANFNLPHSVANRGETNRVHMVLDCVRNEWSDQLFASLGYNFDEEKEAEEVLTDETKALMIEELERQDNDAARAILKTLKNQQ